MHANLTNRQQWIAKVQLTTSKHPSTSLHVNAFKGPRGTREYKGCKFRVLVGNTTRHVTSARSTTPPSAEANASYAKRMQKREFRFVTWLQVITEQWYSSDPWMFVDRSPTVREGKAWSPPVSHSVLLQFASMKPANLANSCANIWRASRIWHNFSNIPRTSKTAYRWSWI